MDGFGIATDGGPVAPGCAGYAGAPLFGDGGATGGAAGCPPPPTKPACAKRVSTAAPLAFCAAPIANGTMTSCAHPNHSDVPDSGSFTSCCPPEAPFSCPTGATGACFATPDLALAVCGSDCVECELASRPDSIGLGQICGGPNPQLTCPEGSSCVLPPGAAPTRVGFCAPPCNSLTSTPECTYASAPPGIRAVCPGPDAGYLANHCLIVSDACKAKCPPGFNCETGACLPPN
jgi:hypothetical protein